MGLRPAKCYRKLARPYTRQSIRVPRKGYVKGVPKPKITQFESGVKGMYTNKIFLLSGRDVQIRHNALEALRVSIVQNMEKATAGKGGFFFKVRVYPHQVLRENALATGAGADRFQQGMRQSFGKPIGTAARVRKDQTICELQVNETGVSAAKIAMKRGAHKMPTPCKVVVQ